MKYQNEQKEEENILELKTNNKKLFYYGLMGAFKQMGGILIIIFGLIISFYFNSIILFLTGFILGVILIFKGKSQRFDYQRQSGYIVHNGD